MSTLHRHLTLISSTTVFIIMVYHLVQYYTETEWELLFDSHCNFGEPEHASPTLGSLHGAETFVCIFVITSDFAHKL